MHTVQLSWTKFENIWGANLSRSVHTSHTFEDENEKKMAERILSHDKLVYS